MLTKRILALLAAGVMACTVLAGCTSAPQNGTESSSQTAQTEAYYTFTDALGKEVVLEAQPERVAVLMGSYAETWTLAGGMPVGVTDDYITERGMEVGEDTKVIGTVKEPNTEELLALDPDFVILSTDVESHVNLDNTLTQAGILDGNILLYHIQHTASGYQMYLYGVNPRTGGVIRSAEPDQPSPVR